MNVHAPGAIRPDRHLSFRPASEGPHLTPECESWTPDAVPAETAFTSCGKGTKFTPLPQACRPWRVSAPWLGAERNGRSGQAINSREAAFGVLVALPGRMTRDFHEKAGPCQAVFLGRGIRTADCRPTGGTRWPPPSSYCSKIALGRTLRNS